MRAGALLAILLALLSGRAAAASSAAASASSASTAATASAASARPAGVVAPADTSGSAHVTSLSGAMIYVDAGRLEGLETGQTLVVLRSAQEIGTLKVDYLASHRAACSQLTGEAARAGDAVRFTPKRREEAPAAGVGTGGSPAAHRKKGTWARRLGLRGRVGARVLAVEDRTGAEASYTQPSLDLRVEGTRVAGSDLDLSVDVRTRRTWRTATGDSDPSLTRVHRLSVSRQGLGSPIRISAGRLASPSLASVNLFDGVLTEYLRPRFGAGLFTGSQPGASDWEFTREIQEYGFYGRLQNDVMAARRWSMTSGGVLSYSHGSPNRDYLFLRGQWSDPHFFGFLSQEVDVNRGWRRSIEGSSLSWTSTLLSLQYRPGPVMTISGGYDNRRNVRLYNDRETPESDFDEAHRQGWSGGISLYPLQQLTLGSDYRINGSGADRSDAATCTWRMTPIPGWSLDLSGRHTRFQTPLSEGWLHSFSCGTGLGSNRHLEAHTGMRNEEARNATALRTDTRWYGASLDIGVGRWLYLLLSGESTRGDIEKNDQYYLSLSYQL